MSITKKNEIKLREYLWLTHGHQGLYGDDGEMQCSACTTYGAWDYKREEINKLIEVALLARMYVNLESLSKKGL